MNVHPSQPSIVPSRPLPGRVATGVSNVLRAAGILQALWRDSRARRRDVRAVDDAITHMNEHMLRDIGAHDRRIPNAAARSDADHRRRISVQLSTPFLVVALIATAALGANAEAADSLTSKASAETQLVGVFTGQNVNGTPVYRLPPVIVVGSRKVERARLEREEQSARSQQVRAKAAAKRPA